VSFYLSTATFCLLHCDEWDRVVALPRHKFVTGATLLQLGAMALKTLKSNTSHPYLWNQCEVKNQQPMALKTLKSNITHLYLWNQCEVKNQQPMALKHWSQISATHTS